MIGLVKRLIARITGQPAPGPPTAPRSAVRRPRPVPSAPRPGPSRPPAAEELSPTEQFLADGNVLAMASTNVDEISWDYKTRTLYVRFLSGGLYAYSDVPIEVAVAFVNTDSPGRFVWNRLRDVYPYKKLGQLPKRKGPNVVRAINS